jgi:protein O-GlcNAc transferase
LREHPVMPSAHEHGHDSETAASLEQRGIALRREGRASDALHCYERGLQREPERPSLHFHRARALRELGRLPEAIAAFERCIQLAPGLPEAQSALSNALREAGDLAAAFDHAQRAIRLRTSFFEAHLNAGAALHQQGKLRDAAIYYLLALPGARAAADFNMVVLERARAEPESREEAEERRLTTRLRGNVNDADAWRALAGFLNARLAFLESAVCLARAAELAPSADAYTGLSQALLDLKAPGEALSAAERGIALGDRGHALIVAVRACLQLRRPDALTRMLARVQEYAFDQPTLLAEIGVKLRQASMPYAAEPLFERCIALEPHRAEHYLNLATALGDEARHAASIALYKKALELDPTRRVTWSNMLFGLQCDASVSEATVLAEHRAFGRAFPRTISVDRAPMDRDPTRRLRIGYVSPDLRAHALAYFIEPVLMHHDPARFEVHCYSDGEPDNVTERLRPLVPHWHVTAGLTDAALEAKIREDRIDILVDLTGHTARNRLLVFAQKPAPVQVSWIGYFATTGLSTMDYRLGDAVSIPLGCERHFVEQVFQMPRSANCYLPPQVAPEVAEAPCLQNGYVTFGCFNNPRKISREVVHLYAEILRRVPSARLIFKYDAFEDPGTGKTFSAWFREEGIALSRIELRGRSPMSRYMASFADIDVALDPFPYSGETTALHTLWMGVPLVSLEGRLLVQRLGARVLRLTGLHELVASTREQYIEIACGLAGAPERLATMRKEIRPRLQKSPLLDHAGITRDAESAFRRMWETYCESAR